MNSGGRSMYTFGHLIQSQIVRNVRKSIFYSVLADETIDISQIEQFSLCVRPNNVRYSTEEEYYRQAVSVPYLDDFCNSLKERFESHKETVAFLQHILPEFCTKIDFCSLEAALNFYEEDLSHKEVMQSEFMLWKDKWSLEKSENLPKTAISSLEICVKTFFPNIYIILKLLTVLPVSVATVERSFSSLRRLKT
ncbi:hypothetical protein AVEN_179152-1 [Araneus ventricosus]|uniref:HAT C-terminal dimerisation domain-containing protein n=1 Tax=Araneus ventricosus TaxID=182803 RepID=A0A4Y2QNQ3_ARAVE|nr:hypothetical protein AVEN_179152-1 [Araneus ventricosus]